MPNIYNPQNQPLSPYLNLLRGGNAGVNYFYGVRPGTLGMGGRGFGGAPFVAGGAHRTLFFPQLASAPDPRGRSARGPGNAAPAGHMVVFSNTMGSSPARSGKPADRVRASLGWGPVAARPRSDRRVAMDGARGYEFEPPGAARVVWLEGARRCGSPSE